MMKRELTATVYLFHEGKVLLHFHPKFGKWLPPGGHVEESETPSEAAEREVLEETTLAFTFLDDSPFSMDAPHAKTLPRPFLSLLENIPPKGSLEAHQHIDSIYLGKITTNPLPTELPNGFRWFSPEQLLEIQEELFLDTKLLLLPPSLKTAPLLSQLFYSELSDRFS